MIQLVILTSILVLIGWAYNLPFLKTLHPSWVTMKPYTAINFLISGTSYFLLYRPKANGKTDVTVALLAFISFGLTLSAMMCAFLQVPELTSRFFPEDKDFQTPVLGTPSIATMFLFFVSSLTSMFFMFKDLKFRAMAFGSFILIAVSTNAVMGYLMGVPWMYYYVPNKSTGMALHTAILFLLIGVRLAKEYKCSTSIKLKL